MKKPGVSKISASTTELGLNHLLPQVEQLGAEQVPQEEVAALLNFPPLEKANMDMTRLTFLLLHFGQEILSEALSTNFSNSCSHWPH